MLERLQAEADTIGCPMLIKAVADGGGNGMRGSQRLKRREGFERSPSMPSGGKLAMSDGEAPQTTRNGEELVSYSAVLGKKVAAIRLNYLID